KIFGNENPIGKTLLVSSASTPVEIIGVVGDVRSRLIAKSNDVEIYRPWAQENFPFAVIAVRSNLREDAATKVVQSSLNTVDAGLAIAIPQSMDKIVAQALGRLITSQLYQTSANNPLLLAATMSILGFAALFACVFPARRAAMLDPVQALRTE